MQKEKKEKSSPDRADVVHATDVPPVKLLGQGSKLFGRHRGLGLGGELGGKGETGVAHLALELRDGVYAHMRETERVCVSECVCVRARARCVCVCVGREGRFRKRRGRTPTSDRRMPWNWGYSLAFHRRCALLIFSTVEGSDL